MVVDLPSARWTFSTYCMLELSGRCWLAPHVRLTGTFTGSAEGASIPAGRVGVDRGVENGVAIGAALSAAMLEFGTARVIPRSSSIHAMFGASSREDCQCVEGKRRYDN